MEKLVGILVVSARGELLMRRGADGVVTAFAGLIEPGDVPVRAAVRGLREETGLEVQADDLEFLDMYADEGSEVQVFVLAGVDEDRVYVYGREESLCKVQRSDDFGSMKLSALARKYVIDYFKSHKR